MNDTINALIRECVQHIADGRLDRLNYYPGCITRSALERVLTEIGSPVIPLPEGDIAGLDVLKPLANEDRWVAEFPLSTVDEQPSDWWLNLFILKEGDRLVVYLDDIHY